MVSRDRIKSFGYVSRMDNLQAAVLNFRLKNLKNVIKKRRENFKLYKKYLDPKHIFFPEEKKYRYFNNPIYSMYILLSSISVKISSDGT